MRRISMATRDELVAATAARYAASDNRHRGLILDEFTSISGFHRKHASRTPARTVEACVGQHSWAKNDELRQAAMGR